ncbi:hypothetical protein MCEGEM3_01983 [Oxalobacteraceae bacterium]
MQTGHDTVVVISRIRGLTAQIDRSATSVNERTVQTTVVNEAGAIGRAGVASTCNRDATAARVQGDFVEQDAGLPINRSSASTQKAGDTPAAGRGPITDGQTIPSGRAIRGAATAHPDMTTSGINRTTLIKKHTAITCSAIAI